MEIHWIRSIRRDMFGAYDTRHLTSVPPGALLCDRYSAAGAEEDRNHSSAWLRHVPADIWKLDLLVVHRQLNLVGVNPAMDALKNHAVEVQAPGQQLAFQRWRSLAAKRDTRAAMARSDPFP